MQMIGRNYSLYTLDHLDGSNRNDKEFRIDCTLSMTVTSGKLY